MNTQLKFMIAVIWDILDFTIFRIPGFGTITDIVSIPLAIFLWGNAGVISAWEVFEPTDQLDAFVPTLTLIGVLTYLGGNK